MSLVRNCQICNIEIQHKTKQSYVVSLRHGTPCKDCKALLFVRECPSCGEKINYSNQNTFYSAKRANRKCSDCEKGRRSAVYSGEGNPFFGKKHTNAAKEKISSFRKTQTPTEKQLNALRGHVNTRAPYYQLVSKYGKEYADNWQAKRNRQLSESMSGRGNHMYGKPTPQRSGNGWSGWYKGWYFRSLRELSYVINIIEKNDFEWRSAEYLKITYVDFMGNERTYRPDFIIGNSLLVECKPKKLWNTPGVKFKTDAAIDYCNKNGLQFELVDPPILSNEEIKNLYIDNEIVFTEKYEKRFKDSYYE